MPNPNHRSVFEPSETYLINLQTALNDVFEDSEHSPLPNGFTRSRTWTSKDYHFMGIEKRESFIQFDEEFDDPTELTVENTFPERYVIFRTEKIEGELLEMRVYDFRQGKLQVTNTIKTIEQIILKCDESNIVEEVFSREVELHEGIHTPAEIEFLDFLADVSSLTDGSGVEIID